MISSLYNGVSGVKTYQTGIDVWGDNIANVNTTAYKEQNVDFATLFNSGNTSTYTGMTIDSPVVQSDIGLGGSTVVTTMDTKQGSIKNTDNVFDLAIEGDGFFKVQGANKETFYTRAGDFVRDSQGVLVNANGESILKFSYNFSDGNSVFGSASFEYLKNQKCIFKDTQNNLFVVVNTTVHNTTPVGELSPL